MSELMPTLEARYRFDQLRPEIIAATVDADIERVGVIIDDVAEAIANPTYANTVGALDEAREAMGWEGQCGRVEQLMRDAHPDAGIRAAAAAGQIKLQSCFNDVFMHEGAYAAVKAYAQTDGAKALPPDSEQARLLADTLLQFRLAGQDLDPTQRGILKEKLNTITKNSSEFLRNVTEDQTTLTFTTEELDGLPEDFINNLAEAPGDGAAGNQPTKRVITMKPPHATTVLKLANRRETREAMWRTFNSVAMERNKELIVETAALRLEVAKMLGFDSWAEMRLQGTMAGTPRAVSEFHAALEGPLQQKAASEVAAMQTLLAADGHEGQIQAYDTTYYGEKIRQRQFGVDSEKIAEYLPINAVINGLFELTGKMYNIRIEEVPGAAAWHEDVKTYVIKDATTGEQISTFHFDLFSRDGKVAGEVTYSLQYGQMLPSGVHQRPEVALVTNFAGNMHTCQLRPDELKKLFHEFGHVLHNSFARTQSVRFAGAKVEQDFLEAPSQIMEHWATSSKIVRRFARNKSGETIPAELIDGLAGAQNVTSGLDMIRYFQLSRFDILLHDGTEPKDIDAIYRQATALSGTPLIEGTFWPGRFMHPFVGYDASYYGYPWAKERGDDMFSVFARRGLRNRRVSAAFRRIVLDPGGSRPANAMVTDFLGRQSNEKAFLYYLGIAEPRRRVVPYLRALLRYRLEPDEARA